MLLNKEADYTLSHSALGILCYIPAVKCDVDLIVLHYFIMVIVNCMNLYDSSSLYVINCSFSFRLQVFTSTQTRCIFVAAIHLTTAIWICDDGALEHILSASILPFILTYLYCKIILLNINLLVSVYVYIIKCSRFFEIVIVIFNLSVVSINVLRIWAILMKLQADGFKTILRNIGTSENKRKSESEAVSFRCPRSDISPKFNQLTNGRTVYHTDKHKR